jgi:hypothetical protein
MSGSNSARTASRICGLRDAGDAVTLLNFTIRRIQLLRFRFVPSWLYFVVRRWSGGKGF